MHVSRPNSGKYRPSTPTHAFEVEWHKPRRGLRNIEQKLLAAEALFIVLHGRLEI